MTSARRSIAALIVLAALSALPSVSTAAEGSEPVAADSVRYPLEPPDRSSPRASLATLTQGIDEGVRLFLAGDREYVRHAEAAFGTLDTSQLPPRIARQSGIDAALRLKEVLDRIELPPPAAIPGAAEVERRKLDSWVIPHTEIELVRVAEGEQAGQFLFSAPTVARIGEFYQRVEHLPYRPGKTGGHYDTFRSGAASGLGRWAARWPEWARAEIGRQFVWQWLGLALFVGLGAVALILASRLSRRRARPPAEARVSSTLWAAIPPIVLLAGVWILRQNVGQKLGFVGAARDWILLCGVVVAHFAMAWLTTVLVTRGAEHVIKTGRVETALRMQLIRVLARGASLFLILMWVYLAGKAMGIPVTALIAGLGVGGLAVALAAQSTIENLIGGVALYADRPIGVGDAFRIGETVGFLEEVGLRSAKVRTRENTMIAIPNADFSKMQLENYSRRTKTLFRTNLHLSLDTTADQLRVIIARLYRLVLEHPDLEEKKADAKLAGIEQYSFKVRYKAYAKTVSWTRFKEIRQELFFAALAIVGEAGARLAVPTEVEYQAPLPAPDPERLRAIEREMEERRERGELGAPPFGRAPDQSELPSVGSEDAGKD